MITEVVCPPGFHTYEVPPEAVSVVLWPEQIFLFPLMIAVGSVLTVMATDAVLAQPLGAVASTE